MPAASLNGIAPQRFQSPTGMLRRDESLVSADFAIRSPSAFPKESKAIPEIIGEPAAQVSGPVPLAESDLGIAPLVHLQHLLLIQKLAALGGLEHQILEFLLVMDKQAKTMPGLV